MYRVRILDAASRELERIDTLPAHRIVERINWLAANLEAVRPEALSGELSGLYKLRVLYEILHDEQMLIIHAIGHRRDVYRKR